MFDGEVDPSLAEPLHHFIATSRASFPNNLQPFNHHHHSYNMINPPHQELVHLHPYNHQLMLPSSNMEIEPQRATPESESANNDPWSDNELLALLHIRSSKDNWFPDFTWEHVSRKLEEVGFKRSAEKCKEKLEKESMHLFNNINFNKNLRFLNELEHLYQPPQNQAQDHQQEKKGTLKEVVVAPQVSPTNDQMESENCKEVEEVVRTKTKKRKRQRIRLERLKGFCEDIVTKLMSQQEEIHNKLLEEMVRREEETKLEKEETWKKIEMDRMNKEIENMAKEQAFANDRQATIIHFLNKFTSSSTSTTCSTNPSNNDPNEVIAPQSPSSSTLNPTSDNLTTLNPSTNDEKGQDVGKRWPTEEVLALINLRCSLFNNGDTNKDVTNVNKALPLWERMSQGMLEMGYKRNAKRCKEKWENINKYYRKTKDVNRKRSLDSRTCPYFHQLSNLYNKGMLVPPSEFPPPPNGAGETTLTGE